MKTENILIEPVITEKAAGLTQRSVYAFKVHGDSNKFQIQIALEKLYKVKVDTINIFNRKGKIRKVGRKMQPQKQPDIKIAYIKLKEGKIDLFPSA